MMNILSIIHYPVFGGPANRNMRVAPVLEKYGVKTTVLFPNSPGNAAECLTARGIDVQTTQLSRVRKTKKASEHFSFFLNFVDDVQRIRKIIRKKRIDLVQINGLPNPHGAFAAKLEGAKVVWQILDSATPFLLSLMVMPFAIAMADVVLCTGQSVAKMHPLHSLLKERLMFFYPPVDIDAFSLNIKRRSEAREHFCFSSNDFIIGTVGNISPAKGHMYFLKSAARVLNKHKHCKFVILGQFHNTHKSYAQDLITCAKSLGFEIGKNLIIMDPKGKVPFLMQAFDLFWLTSLPKYEGVPTVVEEAMVSGLPVVATKSGSVDEIVLNGDTGFVVPPNDYTGLALVTSNLIKNPQQRMAISQKGRKKALMLFSKENCALTHYKAYRNALKN